MTNIKKYDTVRESKQTPKGYWLNIIKKDGESYTHKGISSYSEALYLCKRRYSESDWLERIDVYVNSRLLNQFHVREGVLQMSKFSEYRATAEEKGVGLDSVPPMKAEDRVLFMKGCVPFFVTDAREVDSQYGRSIVYSIQTDLKSPEYEKVGTMLNIQPEYTLWVKATKGRVDQWHDLMEDVIAERERLILIDPPKGAWDFDVYTEREQGTR